MDSARALWIMLVGAAMVLTGVIDACARQIRIPGIVAYLLLGTLLGLADRQWNVLGAPGREAFGLLADIGLIALLFRVGLESKVAGLLAQLRPALILWLSNVAVSAGLGFLAARYWAGLELLPSLVIAVALTATSIGIATSAWQSAGALDSPNGRLMLSVAELDDISGVVLMALLFALVPAVLGETGEALPALMQTAISVALKLVLFAALCFVFARYAEGPLTRLARRLEPEPQRMLSVAGSAFLIAAFAAWLGFSLAVGALLAGLLFSRDPEAIRTEARFTDLYAFFTPFFFIGIGLAVELSLLDDALALGIALLAAAVAGKIVGTMLPGIWLNGVTGAALIGLSLVPRAEIALVIAHQGRAAGALPESAYAALVFVSAVTCVAAPWALDGLLRRWPQPVERGRSA